jgi:hypothetical protein
MKQGDLHGLLDSKHVTLAESVVVTHGECQIPLASVVQILGGKVTKDKKTGRLNVHLKEK